MRVIYKQKLLKLKGRDGKTRSRSVVHSVYPPKSELAGIHNINDWFGYVTGELRNVQAK